MNNSGKRYFKKKVFWGGRHKWAAYDPETKIIYRVYANKRYMFPFYSHIGVGYLLRMGYVEVLPKLPKYLQVDEGL